MGEGVSEVQVPTALWAPPHPGSLGLLGIRNLWERRQPMLLSPGFKGLPRRQLHVALGRQPSLSPLFILTSQVWALFWFHEEQWEGKMEREAAQLKTRLWNGFPCGIDSDCKQTLGAVCGCHRGKEGKHGSH